MAHSSSYSKTGRPLVGPRRDPLEVQSQGRNGAESTLRAPCESYSSSASENLVRKTGSLRPVAIEATRGGNETVGAFETDGSLDDSASRQAVTSVNVEQASKSPI